MAGTENERFVGQKASERPRSLPVLGGERNAVEFAEAGHSAEEKRWQEEALHDRIACDLDCAERGRKAPQNVELVELSNVVLVKLEGLEVLQTSQAG